MGHVNTVVSRLGGVCSSDKVWMTILFPVLAYGIVICGTMANHLLPKLNAAYRMAQKESVCQRLS